MDDTKPSSRRALLKAATGVLLAGALPRLPLALVPSSVPRRDLLGFLAVLVAVAVGVVVSDRFGPPIAKGPAFWAPFVSTVKPCRMSSRLTLRCSCQ